MGELETTQSAVPKDANAMGESETTQLAVPKGLKHGLSTLLERISLDDTKSPALRDAVLVSIDFESLPNIKSTIAKKGQVGLAILDLKELYSFQVPRTKLVSTFNFAAGFPSYVKQASRKFQFGETAVIPASSMAQFVRSHIPDRNAVLVGCGVNTDLRCLKDLGFVFERSPSAILHTSKVASEVIRHWNGILESLLFELGEYSTPHQTVRY